ncbi:hypothetical protein TPA0910_19760 [Streptomyces hygroscopicus subsp. sporocinereus]|uniref:Uncharacterized protein n=1 Tax=Streptomyces hygroscopicus TaxID=1912 RepID=A0ABQ3TW38_STRHY|nr:hypothetical protein TPA0910_19760 [Streptomyces hygroscopicus]
MKRVRQSGAGRRNSVITSESGQTWRVRGCTDNRGAMVMALGRGGLRRRGGPMAGAAGWRTPRERGGSAGRAPGERREGAGAVRGERRERVVRDRPSHRGAMRLPTALRGATVPAAAPLMWPARSVCGVRAVDVRGAADVDAGADAGAAFGERVPRVISPSPRVAKLPGSGCWG